MADEVIVVFGAELDGYNAQIKSAIGANDKLEQSANDTSAQITKDFANSGKAIQQAFGGQQVSKSLDQTKKSAVELKAQIKALYDEEVRLLRISKNVATDGVGAVRKEAALLRSQLPGLNGELGKTGTAIEQASKKGQTLTGQLRGLKQEISALESAGKGGSKAFTDLTIQAARLEDQIGDTRERVRVLASDTFKFDAAVGGIQAVAGAFAGVQGAIGLFGEKSEDVEKALLKVQSSLALVAAAQELSNIATGQGAFKLGIISAAQTLYSSAIDVTTKKLNLFKAAIISTGIGALVVTFGFLIEKILAFNKTAEESSAALKRLSDANVALREESIKADRRLALARKQLSQEEFDREVRVAEFVKLRRTAEVENVDALKKAEAELESAREKQRLAANRQGGGNLDVGIQLVKRAEENRLKVIQESEERIRLLKENFSKDEIAINLKLQEDANKANKTTSDAKIKIKEEENFDLIGLLNEEINAQLRTQAIIAETAVIKDNSIANQTEAIKANLAVEVALLEQNFANFEEREAQRVRLVTEAQAKINELNNKGVEQNADNNKKKLESDEEYTTASVGLAERLAATQKETNQKIFDESVKIAGALFDFGAQLNANKIADLESSKEKELAAAGDNAAKRKEIEEKYIIEVRKLQRKQAIADKAQALFEVAINTAAAVAKNLKNPTLIPFVVALGAIQAATIAATPIPKFEKGGLVKGPRHSQGGVLAELEGDEYITNRKATKRNRPLLEAINQGKEKEFIYKRFQVPIIQANQNAAINSKLNAKLDSARMERELQLSRKSEKNNTRDVIKAIANNKSLRNYWN